MSIRIIVDKCTGCNLCIKSCPFGAIRIDDKKAVIDLDSCTLCGACVTACKKYNAIVIEKEPREEVDLSDHKGVWIFAEQRDGELMNVALELLGVGRELADTLGVPLSAVLLGNEVDGIPVHVSRWLLQTVLREEWGFRGFITSDGFGVPQLVRLHHVAADESQAARMAIEAGVDVDFRRSLPPCVPL